MLLFYWIIRLVYYDLGNNFRQVYFSHEKKYYGSFTCTSRYFGVDIGAIREYAKTFDDIEHLRAEIRLVSEITVFGFYEV